MGPTQSVLPNDGDGIRCPKRRVFNETKTMVNVQKVCRINSTQSPQTFRLYVLGDVQYVKVSAVCKILLV